MEKEVLPVGVDGEVLSRATKALTEYYQKATRAKLAKGTIETMAIIDNNSIDISIRYEGEVLPFPLEEPKNEDESKVENYNLSRSGFCIRQLTDRLRWEQRAGSSRIHFISFFVLRQVSKTSQLADAYLRIDYHTAYQHQMKMKTQDSTCHGMSLH